MNGERNGGGDEQTHSRDRQGLRGHCSVGFRLSPHLEAGADRFDRL
jgi:hypothetical protein